MRGQDAFEIGAPVPISTGNPFPVEKAKRPKRSLARILFDFLHPKVQEAIRSLTFSFCQETLASSRVSVVKAQRQLRKELEEGIGEGESVAALTDRVRKIFSTDRAYEVARTESNRAMSSGQAIAAEQSGVCQGLEWIASREACEELCQPLNGKKVKFGQPFAIDPKGGPYSVILHPPRHPNCTCGILETLDPKWR